MSTAVTVVEQGVDEYIADVEATANGDTDVTITHALGAVPIEVGLCPISADFYASRWAWTASPTANTITITKRTGAGGGTGAQVRVCVRRPHSIGR